MIESMYERETYFIDNKRQMPDPSVGRRDQFYETVN
jgi:hypothetical protein